MNEGHFQVLFLWILSHSWWVWHWR